MAREVWDEGISVCLGGWIVSFHGVLSGIESQVYYFGLGNMHSDSICMFRFPNFTDVIHDVANQCDMYRLCRNGYLQKPQESE